MGRADKGCLGTEVTKYTKTYVHRRPAVSLGTHRGRIVPLHLRRILQLATVTRFYHVFDVLAIIFLIYELLML